MDIWIADIILTGAIYGNGVASLVSETNDLMLARADLDAGEVKALDRWLGPGSSDTACSPPSAPPGSDIKPIDRAGPHQGGGSLSQAARWWLAR